VSELGDSIIEVSHLTKRYKDLVAVDDLSFTVERGEIFGFLGPNGAGKTTSVKMLSGLLPWDSGEVRIDGKSLTPKNGDGRRLIGLSPQEIVVWGALTCIEQLTFMGTMYDLPRKTARDRGDAILIALGLKEKRNRLAKTLSGGMLRRLNIALALIHEPKILILDEPQAGLDPQSRVLVRDYVQNLMGRITVIITTHDMEEAEKLSDRVCIVDRGKLLALDTVANVKAQAGLSNKDATLEDVFISMTGRGLRE
jgi:ABC-2 type transport system ATP-binding protein